MHPSHNPAAESSADLAQLVRLAAIALDSEEFAEFLAKLAAQQAGQEAAA
jgi:hypothetical protein